MLGLDREAFRRIRGELRELPHGTERVFQLGPGEVKEIEEALKDLGVIPPERVQERLKA